MIPPLEGGEDVAVIPTLPPTPPQLMIIIAQVNTIAWNSLGSRLVSGADDRHLKIYDTRTCLVSWPSRG